MGFLIRFAIKFCFWMTLVSLFIPASKDGSRAPGPVEAFTAVREAIGDLSGFCSRQREACETGKAALSNASVRAGEAAKAGYDYVDTRLANHPEAAVKGSIAATGGNTVAEQGDAIKAKLRELALREIIEAATQSRNDADATEKPVPPAKIPAPKP